MPTQLARLSEEQAARAEQKGSRRNGLESKTIVVKGSLNPLLTS
jgi:hypothetical protein